VFGRRFSPVTRAELDLVFSGPPLEPLEQFRRDDPTMLSIGQQASGRAMKLEGEFLGDARRE